MTRAFALPLALCLALPGGVARGQDAGTDDAPRVALPVREGTLVLDDGSSAVVDGGVWLSEALLLDVAKEKARLKAENEALRQAPPVAPWGVVVAVAAALTLGLATGAWVGVEACQAWCR